MAKVPGPTPIVELWPIDRLLPYSKNARTHSQAQIGQLVASMLEWGWTMPILADEAGLVIAGHARLQAAQALEYTDVPVIVARGWTDAQKRAYTIADNKLALNAGWDEELLAFELDELRDVQFDLSPIGFETAELNDLIGTPKIPADFKEVDENIETDHTCPKCGYAWSGGK